MREGGHFSLFIMTKILRKQFKKPHQYNNEKFVKIHVVQIAISWKFCGTCQKHADRNRNLLINFAWSKLQQS